MTEQEIITSIEQDLQSQKRNNQETSPGKLDKKWDFLVSSEPSRFLNQDLTVKTDVLQNFRKLMVFISDVPHTNMSLANPRNLIDGGRRGIRRLLQESLQLLKDRGYDGLLKKYPVNEVGHPHVFECEGYRYTYRWVKHIYSLGLFKEVLEKRLEPDFVSMDIGSSYGIFSYLLKKEYPRSHQILLDFPEQLILAQYFLGMNFPGARMATFKEVGQQKRLTRDFCKNYDFIFLPWFDYEKLEHHSVDLLSNFASFGEMKREWFEFYTKNEPFLSTQFLFTANRFQSAPTYDSDLTILDYPLSDFKALHFGISPIFSHTYTRKHLFFADKEPFSSQYFEFIGRRHPGGAR